MKEDGRKRRNRESWAGTDVDKRHVIVRAKARNNHRETLQTIIGNIQILADTKLDDECTAALNAYTESQLKNNTVTRAGAKKRKRGDDDNGDAVHNDDPDADADADE